MHEWLEALQKSSKAMSQGVAAEELRRAETEAGVPLPGELGDLYSAFNGGQFEGEVVLYPLHGEGEQASVLEKTRKMLVGLPVAGVWRFGLKGSHRHLYTARKAAMVEQGDGGGPLPEWVQALGDEDWLYGTWDEDKKEMKFYRSLSNMLNVLVPPVEREEFGDRTFARAIAAVEGALTELADEEKEDAETAEAAPEPGLDKPAVIAAERRIEVLKRQPAPAPDRKKPAARTAPKQAPAKKAAAQKAPAQKAPAQKAAKKAVAKKAPAKKAAAKKAPARKMAGKKLPAKKAVTKKSAAKKAPAKKAPAKKAAAKMGAAQRKR